MLQVYKSDEKQLHLIAKIEPDSWINLVSPTSEELEEVVRETGAEITFLRAALDEEEPSRIDFEEGQTLIIVDVPIMDEGEGKTIMFSTLPLGIIATQHHLITISAEELAPLKDLAEGTAKGGIVPAFKTQFVLRLLLRVAKHYLFCLRRIDKLSHFVEKQLHRSMKNKELFQLLDLEKSLVYLSTSLQSNQITIKKLASGKVLKLYEEDQDLLDDVLIEMNQAIEMSNIYSGILSGTMDAFASVISNNLNIVMKVLTSVTILLTIPNIIFSFYGMNVEGLPFAWVWAPLGLSLILTIVIWLILKKKDLI